jgi:hypothetical protein
MPSAEAHLARTLADIDDWRIALTVRNSNAVLAKQLDAEAAKPALDEVPPLAPNAERPDVNSLDWCRDKSSDCDALILDHLSASFEQAFTDAVNDVMRGGFGPDGGNELPPRGGDHGPRGGGGGGASPNGSAGSAARVSRDQTQNRPRCNLGNCFRAAYQT